MIWRGVVIGAIVGWVFGLVVGFGFGGFGLVVGGLAGLVAGAWLRAAVRKEIASALADFQPYPAEAEYREANAQPAAAPPAPPQPPEEEFKPEPPLREAMPEIAAPREPQISEPAPEPAPAPVEFEPAEPRYAGREYEPIESVTDKWAEAFRNWLLGGNTIVRVGLIILFIGLSFLARYAASIGLFPLELRLALVAVAGVILLVVGFRKREARPTFALALQGTGVAVLYLTVFSASRLFELIPFLPAFGFMILFCALGCSLALLQNSRGMALASFAGGFAVPIVLGGESDTPLVLFSYYTILNLAILVIAWRRSWRSLNLLGFFVSFGMATVWGMTSYEQQHYAMTQGFLAATVVIYLATAVLYAHNTPGKLGNVADGTLLFGTAVAGFGLQAGLVRPFEYGSAFSALAFGALYLAATALTMRNKDKGMRVLNECMIAIGVGFVTLAVPLALDVKWTSAAWALEGAGAFWVGIRQARWMARLFGLVLQAVAALILLTSLGPNISAVPLANPQFLGNALIAIVLFATAWWLRKPLPHSGSDLGWAYSKAEHGLKELAFLAGFVFTCLAILAEITRLLPPSRADEWGTPVFQYDIQALLMLVSLLVAMWCFNQLGQRKQWRVATWPGRVSLPLIIIVFLAQVGLGRPVLHTPDWIIWFIALGLHVHLMHSYDGELEESGKTNPGPWTLANHAGTVWLLTAMLADCLHLGIDEAHLWDTSWAGVVFVVSGIAALALLTGWAGRAASMENKDALRWPLRRCAAAYYWAAALPLAALVYFGALGTAFFAAGVTDPLPYIPFLNPVDLSVGLALVVLAQWRRMLSLSIRPFGGSEIVLGKNGIVGSAILLFVLINSIWLRTAYHWLGVDWSALALFESFVVQTGLAILWTLLAMGLMMFAYKRKTRIVWISGAVLLAVVVVKLVLIDLSNAGGWERIVTFIGVGTLMLIIGYFFPLPPRATDQIAQESQA